LGRISSNDGASYFLALRKEVGHFRWEHKRTAIVALDKLDDDLSRLVWLVLVEEVPRGRKNLELEFTCSILDFFTYGI
jgi:hypothetical protein